MRVPGSHDEKSAGINWVGFLIAGLLTALALAARLSLLPASHAFPFATFYPAIILSALLCGAGPGLFALLLSGTCAEVLFSQPQHSLFLDAAQRTPAALFLGFSLLVCWSAYALRRSALAVSVSEQKLRALYDVSPVGLALTDMQGRFLDCNEAFRALTGFSEQELRSSDPARSAANGAAALTHPGGTLPPGGRFGPVEKDYRRKDGSAATLEVSGARYATRDGEVYQWTVAADVTERRRADDRLKSLFAAMSEGVIVHGEDGHITEANAEAEAILGLSREQLLGKTPADPGWRAIREDGSAYPSAEHPAQLTLKTGVALRHQIMGVGVGERLRWISINSQRLFDGTGRPDGALATFVDITELKQMTADLREARADMEAILDNIPARITAWGSELTNTFFNRQAREVYGLHGIETYGKHIAELIGADGYRSARPFFDDALAGRHQRYEQADLQSDGTYRYSSVALVPHLHDGTVTGVYALATDISELRRSYERIRELAQRLETVREEERHAAALTLHEGIAQDLFAARLAVNYITSRMPEDSNVREACEDLAVSIDRCVASTRQVAEDLRPAALEHLQLVTVLAQYARKFALLSDIRIEVDELAPFPLLPESTRLSLFRAAQELLRNVARHARATVVNMELRADEGWIYLCVADDGLGMSVTAREKSGSLGLLGIKERFETLGGGMCIEANSAAPSGSRVTVHLPRPSDG